MKNSNEIIYFKRITSLIGELHASKPKTLRNGFAKVIDTISAIPFFVLTYALALITLLVEIIYELVAFTCGQPRKILNEEMNNSGTASKLVYSICCIPLILIEAIIGNALLFVLFILNLLLNVSAYIASFGTIHCILFLGVSEEARNEPFYIRKSNVKAILLGIFAFLAMAGTIALYIIYSLYILDSLFFGKLAAAVYLLIMIVILPLTMKKHFFKPAVKTSTIEKPLAEESKSENESLENFQPEENPLNQEEETEDPAQPIDDVEEESEETEEVLEEEIIEETEEETEENLKEMAEEEPSAEEESEQTEEEPVLEDSIEENY